MSVQARLREKISAAFAPDHLDIVDESHLHKGHAGHDGRGESHFRVTVVSSAFSGQSRVARQRAVYRAVADELADRVHALALTTLTPEEATARQN